MNKMLFRAALAIAALCVGLLQLADRMPEAAGRTPYQQRLVLLRQSRQFSFATTPPRSISGNFFAMVPSWSYNNSQELRTAKGITAAEADNDLVGQLSDYSPACRAIGAGSTGTRPQLVSGNGLAGALKFNNAEFLTANVASAPDFDLIHKTCVFTIAYLVRPTSLAATQIVFTNDNYTGSKIGCYSSITTTGKVEFGITNGTTSNCYVLTDDTMAANNSAPYWVVIRCNGTSGSVGKIRIGSGSDKAFSVSNTISTASASDVFTIGATSSSNLSKMRAELGALLMWNRSLSDSEVATLTAWTPTRTNANPYPWGSGNLDDTYCTNLYRFYDPSDMFTNTSGTSAVSADGDQVKLVKHRWSLMSTISLGRNLASDGVTDPEYDTGAGIASAIKFGAGGDTTDRLTFQVAPPEFRHTSFVIIARQLDATVGSNFTNPSTGSSKYFTITGSNYAGDPSNLGVRWVVHDAAGNAFGPDNGLSGNGNMRDESHFNTVAVTRDGSSWLGYSNGVQDASMTSSSQWGFDQMGGKGTTGNWETDGAVGLIGIAPFTFTPSQASQIKAVYEAALNFN